MQIRYTVDDIFDHQRSVFYRYLEGIFRGGYHTEQDSGDGRRRDITHVI